MEKARGLGEAARGPVVSSAAASSSVVYESEEARIKAMCVEKFMAHRSTNFTIRVESYGSVYFMNQLWRLRFGDERFCFLATCNEYDCLCSGEGCVRIFNIQDQVKHWRGGDVLRHMDLDLTGKSDPLREVRTRTLKECITKSPSGWRPLLQCWNYDKDGKASTHVRCIVMNDYIWQCPDKCFDCTVVSIADIYTYPNLSARDKLMYSSEPDCEGPVVFMRLSEGKSDVAVDSGTTTTPTCAAVGESVIGAETLTWRVMRWRDIIETFTVLCKQQDAPSPWRTGARSLQPLGT